MASIGGYKKYVAEMTEGKRDMSVEKASQDINNMCMEINNLIQYKNKKYGNTVAEPVHIFSKLSPEEGMLVRIDDKLARFKNSEEIRKNDTVDLIGYLIRLCIQKGWTDLKDQYD
jgi:hypothetical protein